MRDIGRKPVCLRGLCFVTGSQKVQLVNRSELQAQGRAQPAQQPFDGMRRLAVVGVAGLVFARRLQVIYAEAEVQQLREDLRATPKHSAAEEVELSRERIYLQMSTQRRVAFQIRSDQFRTESISGIADHAGSRLGLEDAPDILNYLGRAEQAAQHGLAPFVPVTEVSALFGVDLAHQVIGIEVSEPQGLQQATDIVPLVGGYGDRRAGKLFTNGRTERVGVGVANHVDVEVETSGNVAQMIGDLRPQIHIIDVNEYRYSRDAGGGGFLRCFRQALGSPE